MPPIRSQLVKMETTPAMKPGRNAARSVFISRFQSGWQKKNNRIQISDFGFQTNFEAVPQFSYRARNAQGGLVEGVLNCADRAVAIRQIEMQQCIPIKIEAVLAAPEAGAKGEKPTTLPSTQNLKIPHGQLLVFTEQLAHLLQALIYPAFLAVAGAVLITIFITYMVPQLTGFMSQTGGALPLPTRILLQVNHAITGYWWLAAIVVVGAIVGFRALVRTDEGRIAWDRFRLVIPGYGRVIRHRYYAQFSRTLGTLMENGIPLLRALDLVAEIADNRFLELKLVEVRRAVIDGATLSAALQVQKLFPDLFTDMMSVGELTGHFAGTMQTIADVYERELDRTVAILSQLIPPLIIVLIAILVAFVVYSILSAVFEMTHSLQFRPH